MKFLDVLPRHVELLLYVLATIVVCIGIVAGIYYIGAYIILGLFCLAIVYLFFALANGLVKLRRHEDEVDRDRFPKG